ncbi:Hypothetical Protein FCC1311_005817 [Hondaea fermentalgiana]|uniref:Uncharacterized protein n=1 Tax=Hondaea fermentalgiana TaxID=2315210 RepID=A0A2R5GQ68_9STRA|nr:Hypothetical Protein FCC1311_005817 [Hondaea fermentalgiana]|eukprot:GBG33000.1 Hypothetical Protein FCC1311_005817 [Hondaea fermentalgiana]
MLRTLHQKLSSPERRKPSPSETKRRQTQKQTTARLNREKIDLQRQAKLRLQTSRQEQIAKTKEEVMLAQNRAIHERLERAAVAREAKLKSVAKKAENEARKVNEVQFINEMTEQDRTAQLHKKLEDGEKRRLVFIGSIREKAEKQNERVEARRLREEDRERQLREAMQKRHEEAERRKAEALEEQRRKLDEMVIEASAKVSERRTEMEKEREAKLALQRERAERAEQERRSWSAEEEAAEKARFAEEVTRSAEEMQIREKQMKKRARKVKARIASLSDPQETLSASSQGKSILFPTLLAVCTGNSRTSTIVAEEISPDLLTAYLRARSERDESLTQAKRFPSIYWESALAFF